MPKFTPTADIQVLQKRSNFTKKVRLFFEERSLLEVETPTISQFPALDLHIDPFKSSFSTTNNPCYLITSPEYHMKRLLSAGSGSIFQICKAFRNGESGSKHNPEFTIIEWYRIGWNHHQLMDEVNDLLQTLLKTQEAKKTTYEEAFQSHLQIDPFTVTQDQFLSYCRSINHTPPNDFQKQVVSRDELLNYLMGIFIEPELGKSQPEFIYNYPSSQANLAQINIDDPRTSARFEVYYHGYELCNGFYELSDPREQERRFKQENQLRAKEGKEVFPIDSFFLDALEHGMPSCAGVAVGFDRILMLALGKKSIDEVISFAWEKA
ncbi:MAG: lysyl-tRNA synthetase class 2 [bacterium]|jgi:lysyl-tRNA synthetase class 2